MTKQRQGMLRAALLATGLLGGMATTAHAGGLSLSIAMPGLAVSANPAGASIGVAQPGFYGQISVGAVPSPPALIYAQPVLVAPAAYVGPPIYLHVPPGYERHWAEHCREYRACGQRVYFVRDDWYRNVYEPHYRHEHEHEFEHERGHRDGRDHDARWNRDQRDGRHDHGRHAGHDGHGHDREDH